jgi:hypothetical protein
MEVTQQEKPIKQFKQPENKRKYFREQKRKLRIQNKKCKRCGDQGYAKILLTQEIVCARHLVAQLKEEVIRLQKEKETKPIE